MGKEYVSEERKTSAAPVVQQETDRSSSEEDRNLLSKNLSEPASDNSVAANAVGRDSLKEPEEQKAEEESISSGKTSDTYSGLSDQEIYDRVKVYVNASANGSTNRGELVAAEDLNFTHQWNWGVAGEGLNILGFDMPNVYNGQDDWLYGVRVEFTNSNGYGTGIDQVTFSQAFGGATLAHEIGHNFDADHDSQGNACPASGFIMAAIINTGAPSSQFSTCSLSYFDQYLTAPLTCLNGPPDPIFASGFQ